MEKITVIILTKNEEKNIEKCIASAKTIAERVLVIDSGSTDNTIQLAKKSGAETFFHEWQGHAKQFNWALDNTNIDTEWVFRLDADECITEQLAEEIKNKLNDSLSAQVNGYQMRFRLYFMNKLLRHGGTHNTYLVRLFRYGKGRMEERLLDERLVIEGKVESLKADFIHYDYKGLDAWLNKHVWYSGLEVETYFSQTLNLDANQKQKSKRGFYYRLPLFFRARLYFWYRYYFKLGFLDGKEGKIFCFLQAYWFRFLVDAKLFEREKEQKKAKKQ